MLEISNELKQLYKTDYLPFRGAPVSKDLVITFPTIDLVIQADQIVMDSFSLTESICDGDELKFGRCESAEMKVTVANVDRELTGLVCIIKQIVNGQYEMPLGTYLIDSCKRQSDRIFRDLVGYDLMQSLDVDVVNWYNGLPDPITVKAMRESLCHYRGIYCEDQTLCNDSMLIRRTIKPKTLSGRDVMTMLCEVNACFGHMTRNNSFKCLTLTGIGLYPAETLYPAEDLFPAEPTESMGVAAYQDIQYEDYMVQPIDTLRIRQKEEDAGVVLGGGVNEYIIQGNFLLYGKGQAELFPIANNIFLNIRNKYYRPHKTKMFGLPYLEVGDSVLAETTNDRIETFIFKRTLSGIQGLTDEIEASGSEYRSDKIGVQLQLDLLEQAASDLEDADKEIIEDVETKYNETIAKIETTAGEIRMEVSDTATGLRTEISQKADRIDIVGMVVFSDLAGTGTCTINGGNITAGSITAEKINGVGLDVVNGTMDNCYIRNGLYYTLIWGGIAYNYPVLVINTPGQLEIANSATHTVVKGSLETNSNLICNGYILEGGSRLASMNHTHSSSTLSPTMTSYGNVLIGGNSVTTVEYARNTFELKSSSDLRLKKGILSGDDRLKELIMAIKVKSYRYKDTTEDDKQHYGVLAQQLNNVLQDLNIEDSALVEEYSARPYKDEGMYTGNTAMRVNYQELIAPLIYTVQEQQKQIDALMSRIEALEGGRMNGESI